MNVTVFLSNYRPVIIAAIFLTLYVSEHVYPQRKEQADYRHDAFNLAAGLVNAVVIFGAGYCFGKVMVWYEARQWGLMNLPGVTGWTRFDLEVLLQDCIMYWWHRLNHTWTFLWQFHHFHHTDTKLNSTSALRFHTVELLLSYVVRLALFPVLGISIAGFAFYSILFSAVVIFHHSAVRMSSKVDLALRKFFVTPLMHRIHHSILRRETDSNFGSVLPWWDVLFHSYRAAPEGTIEFGTR